MWGEDGVWGGVETGEEGKRRAGRKEAAVGRREITQRPRRRGQGTAVTLPRPHQPSTGALSSSETPKDMAPMKSLREVRSQSHTSTLSRRSTSPGFRLLQEGWGRVRSSSLLPGFPILGPGGGCKSFWGELGSTPAP